MAINDELTKIINLVQLMDLTLNNRPIVDSDGELIKNSLRAIAYIFATLPENSTLKLYSSNYQRYKSQSRCCYI